MLLVAGVGYSHMTDFSFGQILAERLETMEWPEEVRVADFGYGPISILHWFEERPGEPFERGIFIGAMERGREPGSLVRYEWESPSLTDDEIQARVSEAVTGVISLENLLIIADYFKVMPRQATIVELEPVNMEFGLDLSPLVEERMAQVIAWIRQEVLHGAGWSRNGRHEEVTIP